MSSDPTAPPLPGATRDEQSVTSDWTVLRDQIDGVRLVEVRNVVGDSGYVTELFRADWFDEDIVVDQVFQVSLEGHSVSAWHVHMNTTDRLFASVGQVKIVLYDARPASPTHGAVNVFHLGERRPGLVVVPPGVWHGLRNLLDSRSCVINAVDQAYAYESPDHWRVPPDSPEIPYAI